MKKAKLIHISPIKPIVKAIRKCYLSDGNSDSYYYYNSNSQEREFALGDKDADLVKRIIRSGHTSTLEHSQLTFECNMSRGCLQELARHRVGVSLSVQSTRYTLKKILDVPPDVGPDQFKSMIVCSGNDDVDRAATEQLDSMRAILELHKNIKNDILKYALPEALMIELYITFNWRSFRHFLSLRDTDKAHWEIRQLARDMVDCIPKDQLILLEGLKDK